MLIKIILIFSLIVWIHYINKIYNINYIHENLSDEDCTNKACVLAKMFTGVSDWMGSAISRIKPTIPVDGWDGTRGRVDTLLRDIGAVTSSTIVTVGRSGQLVADTGAMVSTLGSEFIKSIQ